MESSDSEINDATFQDFSMYLLEDGKEPGDVIKNLKKDGYIGEHPNNPQNLDNEEQSRGLIFQIPLRVYKNNDSFMSCCGKIADKIPQWAKIYTAEPQKMATSQNYGLFFVKFDTEPSDSNNIASQSRPPSRWMVISHGCGFRKLRKDCIQPFFGLYVALNSISPDQITRMNSKVRGVKPRYFHGINPKGGTISDLRMDFADYLTSVGGRVVGENDKYTVESTMTGGDMLKVRLKNLCNYLELPNFCQRYFAKFKVQTPDISMYHQLVFDKNKISALNKKMIDALQQCLNDDKLFENEELDLMFPWTDEPAEFGKVKFMKFGKKQKSPMDLMLKNYIAEVKKNKKEKNVFESADYDKIIELLKHHQIKLCDCNGASMNVTGWSVLKCLTFETEFQGTKFIHDEGHWYKISDNYVAILEKNFKKHLRETALPPCNIDSNDKKREEKYNKFAAEKSDSPSSPIKYLLLDQQIVYVDVEKKKEKQHNKFEICDLLSQDGEMIHVKCHGKASKMGYVFIQGVNSALFLKKDKKIRNSIIKKVKAQQEKQKKADNYDEIIQRKSKELTVVFAIIAEDDKRKLRVNMLHTFFKATQELKNVKYNGK